jgi:uncharacterized protein YehS (DUF1456 family)
MSNNDIMKKLRVALKLNDQEIVDILKLVDFSITKAELGAIFRNKEHENLSLVATRFCGISSTD